MKKLASNLFLVSGILFIILSMTSDDMNIWLPLGCANVTLGIVFRKKDASEKNSEEAQLNENEDN